MSARKDVLVDLLLELLKEERDQRKKESEENSTMIRLLNQKFERLQTEIFSLSCPRRCGRIECDGEDQVDSVRLQCE